MRELRFAWLFYLIFGDKTLDALDGFFRMACKIGKPYGITSGGRIDIVTCGIFLP